MLVRDGDYSWFHHSDELTVEKEGDRIVIEGGEIIVTLAAEVILNNPALWSMTVERQCNEVEIVYNQDGNELVSVSKDTSGRRIGESTGPF